MDKRNDHICETVTGLLEELAPHDECSGNGCELCVQTGIDPRYLKYEQSGSWHDDRLIVVCDHRAATP